MVAFGSLIGHGQDNIRHGLSTCRWGDRMRMRRSVKRTTHGGRQWCLLFVDHISDRTLAVEDVSGVVLQLNESGTVLDDLYAFQYRTSRVDKILHLEESLYQDVLVFE